MTLNSYPLKDFFFGDSDGKNEANYNQDFTKYYYEGLGYHEYLSNPKYWLILGRKGTGKSLLGWYFHTKYNDNILSFSRVVSYNDFKYNLLSNLEDSDIKPNQFISIWKFLLYLTLGREILRDVKLELDDNYIKLKNFIDTNFSLDLNQNKILDIAIKKTIKGEILGFGGEGVKEENQELGNYLNYIEKLREIVLDLASKSQSNFFLIFDELDDRFRRNDSNKDILISLIKATNEFNIDLFQSKTGATSKIILVLRTDIFSFLKDTDLNKIKVDHGVLIDWGRKIDIHSELFKMLVYKMRKSKPELDEISYTALFQSIFPHYINGISPEKFLLERTFFRPRDVISYINLIVKRYPNTTYIGWKAFTDTEKEYSNYLLSEIENELIGHYTDDFIVDGFKLLKQFKKNKFSLDEIKTYFNANKSRFKIDNLEEFLEVFFEFGVLGNTWQIDGGKNFYNSTVRDDKCMIDFSKDFVLHLGLRAAILN